MISKTVFVYFFILLYWSDTGVTVTPLQPTLNEANQIIPETSPLIHLQARVCKKVLPQSMEVTSEDRAIFVGASTFKEFIRRNNFYTDNSGLIREIIHSKAKVIIITAAQRCGKTMNLKMIQTFLEIPVAENGSIFELNSTFAYNYFANGVVVPSSRDHTNVSIDPQPMISNFPVDISEHLGKYPVIYIDFANIDPSINSIKSKIAEIFNVHKYSLLPYEKIYNEQPGTTLGCNALTIIEKFDNITKGQINECELIRSICFLFEFHNRTKVVILIDEYDHFINQLVSTQLDHKKLLTFYGNFLIASVKSNIFYSTLALLSGTTRVAEFTGILNWECGSVFANIVELNDFNNFCGITEPEKEEMVKLAKDPKYSPKQEKYERSTHVHEATYSYGQMREIDRLKRDMTDILKTSATNRNVSTFFPYIKTRLKISFNNCRADVLQKSTHDIMTVWNNTLKLPTFERTLELWKTIAKVYPYCYKCNISS
ncbi:uncharacterized protein LOC135847693 isoform X3 [Planococcus citri]|uniref:uncharacterized protein LOC135847693 isoform X3 n=1 Tax=Planococcus citri TaxID=170843 RepID=UPI0031F99B32